MSPPAPVHGLVLAGGASLRMGRDKAGLVFAGQAQLVRAYDLLASRGMPCWVSVRADQRADPLRAGLPQLVDPAGGIGPAAGLLAAHLHAPWAAWLVLACDLPRLEAATLEGLLQARDPASPATAFVHADGQPEPLCALWEPAALAALATQVAAGDASPRRVLQRLPVRWLPAPPHVLDNVNTPQQAAHARTALAGRSPAAGD